jgi:hypothetical protein
LAIAVTKNLSFYEFMNDERTTAYLLNELPEPDAEQFEDECFAQPEWPDVELDSAEEDLIQAYIRNELSPERLRRFEEYYLTTEARRERVILARSFLRVVCSAVQPQLTLTQRLLGFLKSLAFGSGFPVPRFATVVVLLAVVVTLVWFSPRTKTPQTFAEINLVISTDTRRGDGSQVPTVKMPLPEDALRIALPLPKPVQQDAAYRVQWEDIQGVLKSLDIEKRDADSVFVIIPADELTSGQYMLKLFRKNPNETEESLLGNYPFNVGE